MTRRCVNFEFLHDDGFTIGEKLITICLEKLCSLNLPTYPNLIREFYGTTAKNPNGIVRTIRGTTITIKKKILGFLLDIPNSDSEPYQLEHQDIGLIHVLGREDCNACVYISA